jgi:hypothetical protein
MVRLESAGFVERNGLSAAASSDILQDADAVYVDNIR